MFKKSKYDIMESETSKNTVSLIFLVGKIYKDLKQYEAGRMNKDYFNAGFVEAIGKGIPSIKAIAHIGYENSKDLVKVNEKSLYKYMQDNGISREDFIKNYNHVINTYAKVLLAFGIVDKENLNVYNIITPEVLLGIVKGEFKGVRDVITSLDVDISKDSRVLIDKLADIDFSISSLSDEQKAFLEKEHSLYMKKHIYARVTKETEMIEVVKYAKSLGKKKSVLEI